MSDQNQQTANPEEPVDLRQKLEDLDVPAGQAAELGGGRKTPKSFPGQKIRLW